MLRGLTLRLIAVASLAVLAAGTAVALPVAAPEPSSSPPTSVTRDQLSGAATTVREGFTATVERDANLVGVQWAGDANATFAIERRDPDGRWRAVGTTGVSDALPDPGSADDRGRPAGNVSEPVWVGDATGVRVEVVGGSARDLRLDRVKAPRRRASGAVAGALVPNQPGLVTRAGWGADEGLRFANCPSGPEYDKRVLMAVVHHTVNSNSYSQAEAPALIRSIYAYHTQSLGYCDIAYNFLVDRFGTVYEGRYGGIAESVHGAHAIGFNTNTTGVALLGDYSVGAPTGAALGALDGLLAWKLGYHDVDPTVPVVYVTAGNDKFGPGPVVMPAIVGHRDTWFTDCPGQNLYGLLPGIRADVAQRIAAAPPGYWHGGLPVGPAVASGPAATSDAPGRVHVFARTGAGELWHNWFVGGWGVGEVFGGGITSDPAAASPLPDVLHVFARGTDGALWHKWYDHGWAQWESLGGVLAGGTGPAVTSWAPGRLDVFINGTDNQLWHRYYAGGWSAWEPLGGGLRSDPGAVVSEPDVIHVFIRGTDDQLWHRFYNNGWSVWEPLGGGLASGPGVVAPSYRTLNVFIRGTDNRMWQRFYNNGWSGWQTLGGVLASAPDATSWKPDRIDTFVQGSDARIWQIFYGNDLYP